MTDIAKVRTYQIMTNLDCNLDCEYCYERKYRARNTLEDCVDFLDACFDRDKDVGLEEVVIDFIGGEPFMYPKLMRGIIEHTLAKADAQHIPNVYFSVSTNGTLFTRRANQSIIEDYGHLMGVGVSIDGLPQTHDKYRIFTTTREGSYEQALHGFNYIKDKVRDYGLKATFTADTMKNYATNMKHLIDIGKGGTISGNVVYEDILTKEMSTAIALQLIEVVDYYVELGLHRDVATNLTHLVPDGHVAIDVWRDKKRLLTDLDAMYEPNRLQNYCGSIQYMTCLGFDKKVYGCNRFMTMGSEKGNEIAMLDGKMFVPVDSTLVEDVKQTWKEYPIECLACPFKPSCGSCVAAPYEEGDGTLEDRKKYHAEKHQCGWTYAKVLVHEYFRSKVGTYEKTNKCNCAKCRGEA